MGRTVSTRMAQALCCGWLLCSGPSAAGRSPVPDDALARDTPGLALVGGVLRYHGRPFSGHVVEHDGDSLRSLTPYVDGKQHGVVQGWYPDGSPSYRRIYRRGHREGTHHGFWPDGSPQFVYHYAHDLFEGEQVAFYKNGVQAELRHYSEGREDGQQKFYDGTGRLIGNYTFRNGKRYGIVGRFDCVSMGAGM